jgi:outer membrane PBP1 activator LpoA protein
VVSIGIAAPLSVLAQGRANATPAVAPAGTPVPGTGRVRLGRGVPTVALLLPRQDGPFGRAGTSLLAGVAAAHARDGTDLTVETVEVDDQADELAAVFAELRDRNFALVLGPLTRNGATALVELGSVGIPTVALNLPEGDGPAPSRVVFMSLATEAESRQAATLAYAQAIAQVGSRRPRAVAIVVASPLARRSVQAFRAAWLSLGGEMREVVEFVGPRPPRDLRARLGSPAPDVAFLAMGAEQARVLRSALGERTAVWSTSLASIGNTAQLRLPELDGMRLLEMPWQVEPDNPAVMAYARAPAGFNVEMQRLYALGIDAFRVGRQVLAGGAAFDLDGVTGRLNYDPLASPRVERQAVMAEYRNGAPVALPVQ